jgi:hypothetical protein
MEKVNCYVDIDCHNIFRYFCQTPVTYSIPRANIELVFNILKKAISDVSIIIEKDNTSQLIFVITDSEYDTTEKFEVNGVIANEYAVIPKPDITTYPIEFKISSKQFKDRMSNVNKFETQVIAIQKYQNEPLQIVCNDYRVAWSGSFNNDEKINFKSKLKENETFVVSVNKENLYCLSNNNLGNDFLVTADHTKKLSFSTVLDERINNPTVVVSVFIDIIGGRA